MGRREVARERRALSLRPRIELHEVRVQQFEDPSTTSGEIRVTLDVQNTGKREGTEVVQLYIRDLVSSVTTYEKTLRGFARVTLAPQEKKPLTFILRPSDPRAPQARHEVEAGERRRRGTR